MNYPDFLESKKVLARNSAGISSEHNENLYDFQQDIVAWALKKARAAIFANTGLGKTPMQLAWANSVSLETGGDVLVLAPLSVAHQTVNEASKFGIEAAYARSQKEISGAITVTNYEMLEHFDVDQFSGVVLDESSILKSFTSKTRTALIELFSDTPFRLACTATPSPNDHMELANHAEFLGVMTRPEMLAMFFTHDGGSTAQWRLKGHAVGTFWEWVASWAVMMQKPIDLGYANHNGYDLPPLNIHQITVESGLPISATMTLSERRTVRKHTLAKRVTEAARIVNASEETFVVWCDLNVESNELTSAIIDAREVVGSDDPHAKTQAARGFEKGEFPVLVTKPSIFGFGLNWQHCRNMVFVGLSDSFEAYYQAVRRCWRFGQTSEVNVYVITSDADGAVVDNIRRKEAAFAEMLSGMIAASQEITRLNIMASKKEVADYNPKVTFQLPAFFI